jgi:hypothetical protein
MSEKIGSNPKENFQKFIKSHSRPLRLALLASAGLALTACIPAGPQEKASNSDVASTSQINWEQIEQACQVTAPRAEGFDYLAPFGYVAEGIPVKWPTSYEANYWEPVNTQIVLTDRQGYHPVTTNPEFDDDYPNLSPDGQKITFVRQGPRELIDEERNLFDRIYTGQEGIYTINIDGTNERRLTTIEPGVSVTTPTWSPDGKNIAYASSTYGERPYLSAGLYIMNSDGSDPRTLVRSDQEGNAYFTPNFSPDGTKLSFRDWSSTYVADLSNNSNALVSKGESVESPLGRDFHTVWMSDSQRLVIYKEYRITNFEFGNRKFLYTADGIGSADLTEICPPIQAMPSSS